MEPVIIAVSVGAFIVILDILDDVVIVAAAAWCLNKVRDDPTINHRLNRQVRRALR